MPPKPFNTTDKNVLKSPMNVAQVAAKPFIGENDAGSAADSGAGEEKPAANTVSGASNNETASKLVENADKNSSVGDAGMSREDVANIKQVNLAGNQSKSVSTLGNVLTANQPINNKTKKNGKNGKNGSMANGNMKNGNKMTKTNMSIANQAMANQAMANQAVANDSSSKLENNSAMGNENTTAGEDDPENDTENNSGKGSNSTTNNGNKKQLDDLNQVSINMFNHYIAMKLYHFQTENYSAHKTSDAYIEKYLGLMDRFLEVSQGIYGKVNLKKYDIKGSSHTDDNIINHINGFIKYITTGMKDVLDNKTDLLTIRDEILSEANQLKYLLTFN